MITSDSGSTKPFSRTGTRPAERVQLEQPRGAIGEVDLDPLEVDALLGDRDANARAVRTAGCVVELHGSSPISRARSLVQLRRRRQLAGRLGRSARPAARRPGRRRSAVTTSVGLAASASSSPVGSAAVEAGHRQVLVDHPAALVEAEANDLAVSSASAIVTAPSRSDSSCAKRPCASRSSSRTGSAIRIQLSVSRTSGFASRGTKCAIARSTESSSSVWTCVVAAALDRASCSARLRSQSSSGAAISLDTSVEAEPAPDGVCGLVVHEARRARPSAPPRRGHARRTPAGAPSRRPGAARAVARGRGWTCIAP